MQRPKPVGTAFEDKIWSMFYDLGFRTLNRDEHLEIKWGNGDGDHKLMEKVLKVKFVSLPNLIVNNMLVPELLLHQCTPSMIARELGPLLLNSPKREWQVSGYKNLRRRLGNSVASDYAAELITDSLGLTHQHESQEENTGEKAGQGPRRKPAKDRRNGDNGGNGGNKPRSGGNPDNHRNTDGAEVNSGANNAQPGVSGVTPDADDPTPRPPRRKKRKKRKPTPPAEGGEQS